MDIKKIEKEYKRLLKCYVDNSHGLAQFQITIPKMKKFEKNIETYNIKSSIEFSSQNFERFLFDFEFNIEVIPLHIIICCKEYNIARNDEGNYIVCISKIISGSEINLMLKNYNIDDILQFDYAIESLEKNTAKKPKIIKEKENVKMILGDNSEKLVKRLVCQLTILFSSLFSLKLYIDCFIIPFDYLFQVYDYNSKSFQNEINIYIKSNQESSFGNKIINKIRPNIFPLHFRVLFPNFTYKGLVEFKTSKSKYILIKNENIPKEFNNNFAFDLDLIINEEIIKISQTKEFLQENNFNFYLILNGQKKEIKINLLIAQNCIRNNKYINATMFKLQKYGKFTYQEKWQEIKTNNEYADSKMLHVSIFGLESPKPEIIYSKNNKIFSFKIKSKRNQMLILTVSNIIFGLGTFLDFRISSDIYYECKNNESIAIIGYCNGNREFWYPTFASFDNYFYEIKDRIKKTKDNTDYNLLIKEIKEKYENQVKNSENLGDYSVLAYMITTIALKWNNREKMDEMKKLLNKILEFLHDMEINKNIYEIFSSMNDNNVDKIYIEVILMLFDIFKDRFETINSLKKEDINKKSDELLQKYFYIDKKKILDPNIIYDSFQDINNALENAETEYVQFPKQGKSLIIKEDKSFAFSEKFDRDLSLSKSSLKKNEDFSNTINFKTGFIDDISIPEKLSIFSLKEFYMKSIKIIRELPLFAINAKIEKNEKKLRKTEEIYVKLLQIYRSVPEQDFSLLGEYVMSFNDQFRKVTSNLMNSNVKFDKDIIPNKFKLEEQTPNKLNEQYIIMPKQSIISNLIEKPWIDTSEKQIDIKQNYETLLTPFISETGIQEFIKKNEEHMEQKKEKSLRLSEKKPQPKKTEPKEKIKYEETPEEPEIEEDKKENLISIHNIKFKKNKFTHFEINEEIKEKQDNAQYLEINLDISIKKEHLKIDISDMNFEESLLIGLVIQRMKEIEDKIKYNKPLPNLGIKRNLVGQPDYKTEKPSFEEFNVNDLYQSGMILANNLVKTLSEKNIPFAQISVNLLIDCSGFIKIQDKLKQFTIICGITNALNIVNIKYAISIVAESQFPCTLKPFDVEHSLEYLQKVLDCLFIKRFIGKNVNWINYALNKTNPNTLYRAILIFSNGMDEDFLLIDEWKEKIFINPNYSFGFFFINSAKICDKKYTEDLDYLKVKWDEFQNKISEDEINIQLYYYNSTFENCYELYNDISERIAILLERQVNDNNNNTDYLPPIFDLNF